MQHHYTKGSAQREGLTAALEGFQKKAPLEVPLVVGGKEVSSILRCSDVWRSSNIFRSKLPLSRTKKIHPTTPPQSPPTPMPPLRTYQQQLMQLWQPSQNGNLSHLQTEQRYS